MITIVEGRPGTGKTVFLTTKILSYLKQGKQVYTNIQLNIGPDHPWFTQLHYIQSLDEIMGITNAKIVLDEVQVYLNSRNWDSLDQNTQYYLQQHRKDGVDIIGATQSVKRADTVFRELVQYFYTLQKIFSLSIRGQVFGLFVVREYDPDSLEVDKQDRAKYREGWPTFILADPYTFKVYDTLQKVSFDSGVGKYLIKTYKIEEKPRVIQRQVSKELVDNL